jgi:hypothetical protein
MPIYVSQALSNVTCMANPADWRRYHNDCWHWFKHAQPFIAGNALIPKEMKGIASEAEYLKVARAVCQRAAEGDSDVTLSVRQRASGSELVTEYLVWYKPKGATRGIFLVVKACGAYGELQTMFPPDTGRTYFDDQKGAPLQ